MKLASNSGTPTCAVTTPVGYALTPNSTPRCALPNESNAKRKITGMMVRLVVRRDSLVMDRNDGNLKTITGL